MEAIEKLPDDASVEYVIDRLIRIAETIRNDDIKIRDQAEIKKLRGKFDWQGDLEKMRLDD